jgi:DUF971 family protein
MQGEPVTPSRLNLKKDEKLEVEWSDGSRSVYPISLLRGMCPCAACKTEREQDAKEKAQKKPALKILSGDHSRPLAVVHAELVGGYAIRLDWSDGHGTGIYSWQYLREIAPR